MLSHCQELEFWQLDFISISMCCWSKFDAHRADAKIYEELDTLFEGVSDVTTAKNVDSLWSWARFYTYHILEDPNFSVGAKV